MAAKEIKAVLSLKDKKFKAGIGDAHKSVLKFTGAITAVGAAVAAATAATAKFRDDITKTSRAAGSTVEEFSALRYAGELSGISMQNLAKGLRKITEPSSLAQKELSRLGVSLKDSSGQARSQTDILADLADKYKGMETPAQKAGSAMLIFGERGAEMVNLLGNGSEGIKSMTDEAQKMGITFNEKAGVAAELFNDNITRVTSSLKGLVQQATGSIIEFVNQTEVMKGLASVIQSITGWWMGLDEETKQVIVTIGGVVTAIAGITFAIMGFVALAPLVGSAITTMTGGLNLVVVGIAAAIAAFVAISAAAVKHWDQVKQAIQPAIDVVKGFVGDVQSALQPVIQTFSSITKTVQEFVSKIVTKFKEFTGMTDDSSEKFSILGTVAKTVFAVIGTAITIVITPFKTLFTLIYNIIKALQGMGKAAAEAFKGNFKEAQKIAAAQQERLSSMAKKIKEDWVGAGQSIKNSFSKLSVKINPAEAVKNVKKIKNSISAIQDTAKKAGKKTEKTLTQAISNVTGKISSMAGQISGFISGAMDLMKESMSRAADAASRKLEIFTGHYMAAKEKEIEETERLEDEKIAALESKYDEEISSLEAHEKNKLAVIENAANERLLALDNEYQTAKEKQEAEWEQWMEAEAERYEQEKELLLQKAIDKEQRMLVEAIMDQDFKQYMENQQAIHEQNMNKLASDYMARTKAAEDQYNTEKVATETATKDQIEKLNKDKNDALEKADKDKNDKLKKLEENRLAEEKKLKKYELFMSWQAEKQAFEQTKALQVSQTIIQGVAGAAQAFAMAAGTIPIVGVVLGGILAAAVLGMSIASASQIATKQIPPPPGLFMASGGYVSGPSHSAGGVPATLEGGEAVIDKSRTRRLLEAVDGSAAGGKNISIIFESGSIQNSGDPMDESFIDKLSYAISRRLERQGVYA